MLTPNLQSRFIEKVLTDRAGRKFRVLFLVSLVDGEVKAQFVSAQPIENGFKIQDSRMKNEGAVLCLPCTKADFAPILESYILNHESILSPYSSLEFFMSQPTRAPSL